MPKILQGSWFSWETGQPTLTTIDQDSWNNQRKCHSVQRNGSDYTLIMKEG